MSCIRITHISGFHEKLINNECDLHLHYNELDLLFLFVIKSQGERGPAGPPGIQGDSGIGLPGPKVSRLYLSHHLHSPKSPQTIRF